MSEFSCKGCGLVTERCICETIDAVFALLDRKVRCPECGQSGGWMRDTRADDTDTWFQCHQCGTHVIVWAMLKEVLQLSAA